MTRKDYELIARLIRGDGLNALSREDLAEAFADELAHTNPRFDRERFIAACMSEEPEAERSRVVNRFLHPQAAD